MFEKIKYDQFFNNHLDKLKQEGRYRVFIDLERPLGLAPKALWHHNGQIDEVVVWCSNDYLGMSHHPKVIAALREGADKYGAGSGGTRNISGTAHPHVQLESQMAAFHGKESGLIFSSGYVANEASISSLAGHLPQCVVLSDEANHASMIQGIRNSRADKLIFQHNDMIDLEEKLSSISPDRPKLIVFTSVYSMEGDIAPISQICTLAKKYNALTYVDEVHAVGMYGAHGAGVTEQLGIQDQLDIIQGNFAKGFGIIGGYITGRANLIDFVRSTASGFIFTTSMPPSTALAVQASLKVIQEGNELRQRFWANVSYFKNKIQKTTLPFRHSDSHIVPVVIGHASRCKEICDTLLYQHGIYIQPINYPTVPVGQERLRITITPHHTFEHIDHLLDALVTVCEKYKKEKSKAA